MLHKSLEKRIVWAEKVTWSVCKSQFMNMFLRHRCESLCRVCTVSWYKDVSCFACGRETLLDRLEPTSATLKHRTLSFFRSLSPHHHYHHCRRGCRIETRVFTDMESQRTNLVRDSRRILLMVWKKRMCMVRVLGLLFIFVKKDGKYTFSACHNKMVMWRSRYWGAGGD